MSTTTNSGDGPVMGDDQLQMEVDWCLARLEEKLAALDPYSRPAQEAAKVHRILKSSKAPVIKKRQAMRNMFGDYRAKMKAMEKKSLAAMKKSKLVPVTEPPTESKFLRRSTGAQATHEASENSISAATDYLNQMSVSAAEANTTSPPAKKRDLAEPQSSSKVPSAEAEFKFNFDGSESGPDTDSGNAAACSSGSGVQQNYFVIKPSNEEFRFNFVADEND